MPIIRKQAKDTLTAVEMNEGDVLEFTLVSGRVVRLELLSTDASIIRTTLKEVKVEENRGRTDYQFSCRIRVDGSEHEHTLQREVSTQRSFYEPWEIAGLRLWFDAADKIFDFLLETHGPCRTNINATVKLPGQKHARFAVQDATLRICPEPLHPWCPLPEGGLKIEHCYRGEDCWLGAYNGASAHGGLDINHEPGTPLWAPVDVDTQFYCRSLETGHVNNEWRGLRRWANGAEWVFNVCHMTKLTVPQRVPITRGTQFASGAGVRSGSVHHSHFEFMIHDDGDSILLDPWILFWQMYQDLHHFDTPGMVGADAANAFADEVDLGRPR